MIIEEHTYTGRERFAEHEAEVDETMAVSRYVDMTSELPRLPSGSGVRLANMTSGMDPKFIMRWRA